MGLVFECLDSWETVYIISKRVAIVGYGWDHSHHKDMVRSNLRGYDVD